MATVITSLASALPIIGQPIVNWLWGGFSVDNPTLNRFYSFHYLFPFILTAIMVVHLAALHQYGSTNPIGVNSETDQIDFYPYYYAKDLVGLCAVGFFAALLVFFYPDLLSHPDNNIPANPYSTPAHIVPEWYFRAPLRYYLTLAFLLLCIAISNYSKTLLPHDLGNDVVRSGDERRMSEGGSHKKSLQVSSGMVKLINLSHSLVILPWIVIPVLLMNNVGHEHLPESENVLDIVDLYNIYQMFWLQGPNPENRVYSRTMALPKGRKPYGKRVSVVGLKSEGRQVTNRNKTAPIIPQGCGKLVELRKIAIDTLKTNSQGKPYHIRYPNLIHYISNLEILILAYELIKSKPGNMTKGGSSETLDGITLEDLSKISKKLLSGKFKFSPARRIWIPKPGKTEKKRVLLALEIVSPREKIVQKAMELVLLSIYEPIFLDTSHGFRPNKSTHSALKRIDEKSKGVVWFIEADISKCFDTICHNRLMDILKTRISCQKTLSLLRSSLKAGYIEMGKLCENSLKGTPQGSVLSPLLCNIYLHELDLFMNNICLTYNKGVRRKANPKYTKVLNKMANSPFETKLHLCKELRKYSVGDPMDPNFVRVSYVRYADDFLVSVIGPYNLAVEIKDKISQFLKEQLSLLMNKSKTLITKASKKAAFFLGTEIKWRVPKLKKIILTESKRKTRITARIALLAPMKKIIDKLIVRKFVKWNPNGTKLIPTGLKRLQNLDHADIISYYNAMVRDILNYYSFADNRRNLGAIIRYLHMSCARTLALKYKLRFMSKAYKEFGKNLTCPTTKVNLFIPITLKKFAH